jgi:hypothetical protein
MAANLDLIRNSVVVGAIDYPDREPEDAALDLLKHGKL